MMRGFIIFGFTLFALASTAEQTEVVRLSEPVLVTDNAEVFGAKLDPAAQNVSLDALLDAPETFSDLALRVDTRVSQVCQKKGCFYIATDGTRSLRVSLKDYAFFLPTDIGGKTVTLTGQLVKVELSEEQAEHFREDADSDAIKAGAVYELVANAVSVPLS